MNAATRKYGLIFAGALSAVLIASPAQAAFVPNDISGGTNLWLDANDLDGDGAAEGASEATVSAGSVTAWNDKSGNGRDLAASGSEQPTQSLGAFGLSDGINFDGTDDRLLNATDGTGLSGDPNFTVFIVQNMDAGAAGRVFQFGDADAGNGGNVIGFQVQDASTRFNNGAVVYSGNMIGNQMDMYVYPGALGVGIGTNAARFWSDGTERTTGDSGPGDLTLQNEAAVVGSGWADTETYNGGASFIEGDVGEVLIFGKILSEQELKNVGAYLATKNGQSSAAVEAHSFVWTQDETDPPDGLQGVSNPDNWRNDFDTPEPADTYDSEDDGPDSDGDEAPVANMSSTRIIVANANGTPLNFNLSDTNGDFQIDDLFVQSGLAANAVGIRSTADATLLFNGTSADDGIDNQHSQELIIDAKVTIDADTLSGGFKRVQATNGDVRFAEEEAGLAEGNDSVLTIGADTSFRTNNTNAVNADGLKIVVDSDVELAGTGNIVIQRNGASFLSRVEIHSANNTLFTGAADVAAGVLAINGNNALVNASEVLVGNPFGNTESRLMLMSGGVNIANDIDVLFRAPAAGVERILGGENTSGTATFHGNVTLGNGANRMFAKLSAEAGGTVTFAGNLVDPGSATSGSSDVTKIGDGVVILAGANTYTGSTTVDAGTLLLNGTHTGGAAYTVAANATLGGTGSTDAALTVNADGHLAVGASTESLETGSLLLNPDANFDVEIGGTDAGAVANGYDQLIVTGGVELTDSLLNIDLVAFSPTVGDTFFLIDNDLVDAVVGTFAGLANDAAFIADGQAWRIRYNTDADSMDFSLGSGNDVAIQALAVIPTPAAGPAGLALLAWAGLRRRR